MNAGAQRIARAYQRRQCREEYEAQAFSRFTERPVELAFAFSKLAQLYPRRVLDVGTGRSALPQLLRNCGFLVTASDNIHDYWAAGSANRHYHVIDDDITSTRLQGPFDLITCISVLEHVVRADLAFSQMLSLLSEGGHLILTCPYTERSYARNVYEMPGSAYGQNARFTTQSFSRAQLDEWLAGSGARIVEQEYWQAWTGSHWTIGEQVIPPVRVGVEREHQLTCLLIRRG
jgi:2-polyprenyl-3-methyl-5-hydroxy-6-metoxy-1,4-benzoquinol methylase